MYKIKIVVLIFITFGLSLFADESSVELDKEKSTYDSKHFAIGVGVAAVKFDTNVKATSQKNGTYLYLDVEGNLNLPDIATITTFYGAYKFNDRHSILLNYFAVKRSTSTISVDETYDVGDEHIVTINADVDVHDRSKFYNLNYGYTLFRNQNGTILLVAGLNTINLNYSIELEGELTVDGESVSGAEIIDADVYAPLPLFGVYYTFNYTKKFSTSAKVTIVGGKYQDIKAAVINSTISSTYYITDHIGLRLGISYFDASIAIDDPEVLYNISYGYKGVDAGVYFAF